MNGGLSRNRQNFTYFHYFSLTNRCKFALLIIEAITHYYSRRDAILHFQRKKKSSLLAMQLPRNNKLFPITKK